MRKAIVAIMMDTTLTDAEKAKKRQELLTSRWTAPIEESSEEPGEARRGAGARRS